MNPSYAEKNFHKGINQAPSNMRDGFLWQQDSNFMGVFHHFKDWHYMQLDLSYAVTFMLGSKR